MLIDQVQRKRHNRYNIFLPVLFLIHYQSYFELFHYINFSFFNAIWK